MSVESGHHLEQRQDPTSTETSPSSIAYEQAGTEDQDIATDELNEDNRTSDAGDDGEGDVEIEQVGDENNYLQRVHLPAQSQAVTCDVRRRTLINVWQRAILEEFYRGGMWSAALQLHHLHAAAAEKTGLDLTVVKNWIRNRRRPTAARSAEKLVEYISQAGPPTSIPPLSIPTITPIPTITTTVVPVTAIKEISTHQFSTVSRQIQSTSQPAVAIVTGTPTVSAALSHHSAGSLNLGPPEAKKTCIEPTSIPHHYHPITSPPSRSPYHFPTSTPKATPSLQSSSLSHLVTPGSTGKTLSAPMLVKVRISESGDEDFVEVEVPSLTYQSLLKAICDELEIALSDVAKIRKLPNILVRKDKDVQRLREGQELEVILSRTLPILNPNSGTIPGRGDAVHSILADLSADSIPTSLHELTGGHVGSHQVNGLH